MKKVKNASALAVLGGSLALTVLGAAEVALWWLSGYAPLLALAMLQLMGGVLNLLLQLPAGKQKPLRTPGEEENKFKRFLKKLGCGSINLGIRIGNAWNRKHEIILAVLSLLAMLAANWVFWPNVAAVSDAAKLAYYQPVALAVLFVLSVVLEKWCAHIASGEGCDRRSKAIAGNLKGLLFVGRLGQILTAVTMVISLLGLYDAQRILQILLLVLFLYETVMLLLSIAIRLIRKELGTEPSLPMSVKAVGSSGVLSYLEENTGITMRSLWSIRLVRQLIPSVLLFVVLLTWLATGIVQVEAHQEGALYRLGKLRDETLKPGLHLTLPWPFDRVETVDTQSLRRVVVGYIPNGAEDNTWTDGHGTEEYRLLLGGGNELVSINLQVEYRISDLNRYLQGSAAADSLLSAAAYEIVTTRTISTDIDSLLAADRPVFSQSFRDELVARMVGYDVGIEVTNVVIESIHPPVDVADVYQQVISAGTQAEQLILEAQREAVVSKASAHQQAFSNVSIASTTYHQQVAKAKGAVAEFMAAVEAYNSFPSAYTYYKYMNSMTESYKKGVVIIVGDGVDSGSLVIGDLSRPVAEDPYYLEEEVEEEYYE